MKLLLSLKPQLRRNLLLLLGAGILFWASLSSLLPIIPLYAESLGASSQQVGWITGGFAIGLILSRPKLGHLADTHSRKLVLLIGIVVAATAPLGYFLLPSVGGVFVVRALHGISIAAFATAYVTLVVDLAPSEQRGQLLALMSLATPLGMVIGPATSGFLLLRTGYGIVFAMAAALAGLGYVCLLAVASPPLPRLATAGQPQPMSWRILRHPGLGVPLLVLLCAGFACGTLVAYAPQYIRGILPEFNFGLVYTAAAIGSFSVRLFVGRAADYYGRGIFIALSLVSYSLAMFLLWSANSSLQVLLAGVCEGTAMGVLMPMISALLADRTPPELRGRLFGFCISGFDIGIALAGLILGLFSAQLSYRTMFAIATLLPLLGLLLFATQSSCTVLGSLRFAFGFGPDGYALRGKS